jgi:hypothetical protein
MANGDNPIPDIDPNQPAHDPGYIPSTMPNMATGHQAAYTGLDGGDMYAAANDDASSGQGQEGGQGGDQKGPDHDKPTPHPAYIPGGEPAPTKGDGKPIDQDGIKIEGPGGDLPGGNSKGPGGDGTGHGDVGIDGNHAHGGGYGGDDAHGGYGGHHGGEGHGTGYDDGNAAHTHALQRQPLHKGLIPT